MGKGGKLPWHIPEDHLERFNKVVGRCPIILGRITWDGLPEKPTASRPIIILSRSNASGMWLADQPFWCPNPDEVDYHLKQQRIRKVFVAGGRQVFELYWDRLQSIHITGVITRRRVEGDIEFPFRRLVKSEWNRVDGETVGRCAYQTWHRLARNQAVALRT